MLTNAFQKQEIVEICLKSRFSKRPTQLDMKRLARNMIDWVYGLVQLRPYVGATRATLSLGTLSPHFCTLLDTELFVSICENIIRKVERSGLIVDRRLQMIVSRAFSVTCWNRVFWSCGFI